MAIALYIASALGAVALFLMMPRRTLNTTTIGALIGALTLGGVWLVLSRDLPASLGIHSAALIYYYLFSALAIASATRVITHSKPVYAALWFVLLVLSSTGLLLILSAEFMAFAMIMIYAGAILVTYVFVIMLAAHAGDPTNITDSPDYERIAHEPAAAVLVGFLLLASLLSIAFSPLLPNEELAAISDAQLSKVVLTNRTPNDILEAAGGVSSGLLPDTSNVTNIERIGVELFEHHPLGLELAGIILLVSLIGAVVIARKKVTQETTESQPTSAMG